MFRSPSAPFCGRAVQLVGCKSQPASLRTTAHLPVGWGGEGDGGVMASSSVGVTLRRSFSPPLPSSCIPGGSGRVPASPRGADPGSACW